MGGALDAALSAVGQPAAVPWGEGAVEAPVGVDSTAVAAAEARAAAAEERAVAAEESLKQALLGALELPNASADAAES